MAGRVSHLDVQVPLDVIPGGIRARVQPETPVPLRTMAARALLPLEPTETVIVLAYLSSSDPDSTVRETATASLGGLPANILAPTLRENLPPEVLAACVKPCFESEDLLEVLVLNKATPDEAIAYIAAKGKGRVLDVVAANQVRLQRHADITEALYFNPATPSGIATATMEFAVRSGLDLSHIPGYREISIAIFGEPEKEKEEEAEDEAAAEGVSDELFGKIAQMGDDDEVSPDLAKAIREGHGVEELEDETSQKVLWLAIRSMTAAQKIRLALVGSKNARNLLIRDPKKVVALAVLRSPRLTDKEISGFAGNRMINEDVIRAIAFKREWTKSLAIRQALVTNPKCPPAKSMAFLRTLPDRDLKNLARDRDVPGHVSVQAKRLLTAQGKI